MGFLALNSFFFYCDTYICIMEKIMFYLYSIILIINITWVLSSVVEHLTADQEVIGSNPIVPLVQFFLFINISQ